MSGFLGSASWWSLSAPSSSAVSIGGSFDEQTQLALSLVAVGFVVLAVAWACAFVIVIQRERRR